MPEAPAKTNNASSGGGNKQGAFKDKDKPTEIRMSNITAAKGIDSNICVYVLVISRVSVTTTVGFF